MTGLLEAVGIHRRYGSVAAVDGVDLRIPAGGRHAIIGPNGAGKSTLINLIAGHIRPDRGRIVLDGRDITRLGPVRRARLGVGRTHQRPAVWPSLTVLDNVVAAAWRRGDGAGSLLVPSRRRRRLAGFCAALLDDVELSSRAGVLAGTLSHGQRRQLELAIALAGRPRLLLLDEPAAGLSARELHRLTDLLLALPPTVAVLLVEHHLELVETLADTVTELRAGRATTIRAPGVAPDVSLPGVT